jgi:hypothetical protein
MYIRVEVDMKHDYLSLCFTLHPYLESMYVRRYDERTSDPAQWLYTILTYALNQSEVWDLEHGQSAVQCHVRSETTLLTSAKVKCLSAITHT